MHKMCFDLIYLHFLLSSFFPTSFPPNFMCLKQTNKKDMPQPQNPSPLNTICMCTDVMPSIPRNLRFLSLPWLLWGSVTQPPAEAPIRYPCMCSGNEVCQLSVWTGVLLGREVGCIYYIVSFLNTLTECLPATNNLKGGMTYFTQCFRGFSSSFLRGFGQAVTVYESITVCTLSFYSFYFFILSPKTTCIYLTL